MNHPLPLETQALRLRQFVVADTAVVFALSQEEAARTWLPSQVYRDIDHARAVLTFLIDQYAVPGDPRVGPFVLAIEHRAEAAVIGHVGFSPLNGDVEIGFSIGQHNQRQGLATEAVAAASRWACQTFGMEQILGITARANVASQHVLVRAGFVHQGNKSMVFQGTRQDVCVYTLSGI